MELGRLWKPSMPETKGIGERPKHGVRNSKFLLRNPKAGDINYGIIAHGNDKSRNTVIRDVIVR